MSHRVAKFASTLKQALGRIFLFELDNPEFKFVTIAHIEVTPDLKRVFVSVSALGVEESKLLADLQRALPAIRRLVASQMVLKTVPEIVFAADKGAAFQATLEHVKKHDPTHHD
jgi:ribosome-binding factor A